MTSFFVSSVVKGFEDFRKAAKAAIELQNGTPLMSENFGARTHSSEKVCLTEIEQSDVFLLILAATYGYITPEGISVTQSEFNHARSLNKKILVFIQQTDMEEKQLEFRKIVENYSDGFFRASFTTPLELKDEIIRGIARLNASLSANTLAEFLGLIKEANAVSYDRDNTLLRISFWSQPIRQLHLPELDRKINNYFIKFCEAGFADLKDGYEPMEEGRKEGYLGINTKKSKLKIYENGLTIIEATELNKSDNSFSYFAISPSIISTLAKSAFSLIESNSLWCEVSLIGIENKAFKEIDSNQRTFSIAGSGFKEVSEQKLFQPVGLATYESWIETLLEKWERKLNR